MKKLYSLLTLGLLLTSMQLSAQNHTIDSLNALLDKHPQPDTIRIKLLNELAYELMDIGSDKSLKIAGSGPLFEL